MNKTEIAYKKLAEKHYRIFKKPLPGMPDLYQTHYQETVNADNAKKMLEKVSRNAR